MSDEYSDSESSNKMERLPIESKPMDGGDNQVGRLDRQKITPMYLRMYCRMGGHHSIEEFERDTVPADDELTVYTWKDATLKELAGLIKEVNEESRRRDVKFSFRSFFRDNFTGRWRSKDLGMVFNSRSSRDDNTRLDTKRFQQGDLIDVAIFFSPAGIAPPDHQ